MKVTVKRMIGKQLNRFFKGIINVIDGLFFIAAFALFDVTIYLASWFWGGIVTAITLIILGLMSEIVFSKGSDK